MHLVSSLLFAISANIDSLIIGFLYGIKKTHLSIGIELVISVITSIGTMISIGLGMQLVHFIPIKVAQTMGSFLLIALGLYYIIKDYLDKKQNEENLLKVTEENCCRITMKEAVAVGAALSVNNMGMGIGVSVAGINLLMTSVMTFIFSLLFLVFGNNMGKSNMFKFVSRFANTLSGIIILILGVYEFFI